MAKYSLADDKIPEWLVSLPAGRYTCMQIADIVNRHRNSVYMRLETIKVEKVREIINKVLTNVYLWKGAHYYCVRMHENKIKKLEKRWA